MFWPSRDSRALQKDLAACLRRHETLGGLRRLWLFPSAHRLGRFVVLFLFLCRGSLLSSGSIVCVRRARRQQEIPKAGSEPRQHYDDVGLHVRDKLYYSITL